MNRDIDIDRVLDEWLGAGPSRVSDRVFDMVAERIERQGQRPSWRLNWREVFVTGRPRAAVVSAMAIAVAAVLIFAISRSHNPAVVGASPTPTASALGLVQPSPAPTESPGASVAALPSPASPLIYRSNFEIPLTVSLADGWTVNADSGNELQLINSRLGPQITVTVGEVFGFSSSTSFLDAYAEARPDSSRGMFGGGPDDPRTLLLTDLCSGWKDRTLATEGGLAGVQFGCADVGTTPLGATPLYPKSVLAQPNSLPLDMTSPMASEWFWLDGGMYRVFVGDLNGQAVVITSRFLSSSASTLVSPAFALADDLIKTLQFPPADASTSPAITVTTPSPTPDETQSARVYHPGFDIPMTITLSSDWTVENDSTTVFQVQTGSPEQEVSKQPGSWANTLVDVTIGRPYGYSSAAAYLSDAFLGSEGCHAAKVGRCHGWIQGSSRRTAMTEAGLSGTGFSISNASGDIPLFPVTAAPDSQDLGFPGGWFEVYQGTSAEVFVADAGFSPVVITVRWASGQAAANLNLAGALLTTLRFQP